MNIIALTEIIVDIIIYWASYNLFHIIKLEYLNPLFNIKKTDFFLNSVEKPVDTDNMKNLIFYATIVCLCIYLLYLINTKQL